MITIMSFTYPRLLLYHTSVLLQANPRLKKYLSFKCPQLFSLGWSSKWVHPMAYFVSLIRGITSLWLMLYTYGIPVLEIIITSCYTQICVSLPE